MKKSVDVLKAKYTKISPNKLGNNNEVNGMNYNEVNNEEYPKLSEADDLQNEIAIKEPPAHIQRRKKTIMNNSNKNSEKSFSKNGSKNTWIKKTKKILTTVRKDQKLIKF
jgi:hypothetical protein